MGSPTTWWTIGVVLLSAWLVALVSRLYSGLWVHTLLLLAIAAMVAHAVRAHGGLDTRTRLPRW